jgi:hypothetical protein
MSSNDVLAWADRNRHLPARPPSAPPPQFSANIIDLRTSDLPANQYDMITAMDVFEHLSDPLATVSRNAGKICSPHRSTTNHHP